MEAINPMLGVGEGIFVNRDGDTADYWEYVVPMNDGVYLLQIIEQIDRPILLLDIKQI